MVKEQEVRWPPVKLWWHSQIWTHSLKTPYGPLCGSWWVWGVYSVDSSHFLGVFLSEYCRLACLEWAVIGQVQQLYCTVFTISLAGIHLYVGLICPQVESQSLKIPALLVLSWTFFNKLLDFTNVFFPLPQSRKSNCVHVLCPTGIWALREYSQTYYGRMSDLKHTVQIYYQTTVAKKLDYLPYFVSHKLSLSPVALVIEPLTCLVVLWVALGTI